MENAEFTAIDLYGGPGSGHVLRSDGAVARWSCQSSEIEKNYEVELKLLVGNWGHWSLVHSLYPNSKLFYQLD